MADSALSRLREALTLPPGESKIRRADVADLLTLAEMAERLRRYAAHKEDCRHFTEARVQQGVHFPGSCSCGGRPGRSVPWGVGPGDSTGEGGAEQVGHAGAVVRPTRATSNPTR